jgi:beta-glucosidase
VFASSVLATDKRGDPQNVTNAIYKDPTVSIDDRVSDLLWRMTIQEKTAQLVQGDIQNWLNMTDNTLNSTGLAWTMATRAGTFYVG